jgi:PleD family two-component response regulator
MGLCIFITINRTINIILGKLGDYMEQKKIAVVDDNEDICRMVKQYLEFNNYYVETYEEGNKALENIISKEFDLILLDIMMSDMGYLFKCTIPIQFSFLASVLLFILSSWQIPLFMYVSMRFSTSFAVIIMDSIITYLLILN